jgi:hypothetical protein
MPRISAPSAPDWQRTSNGEFEATLLPSHEADATGRQAETFDRHGLQLAERLNLLVRPTNMCGNQRFHLGGI